MILKNLVTSRAGKAESKVPGFLAIIILLIVGFLGYKFVPVYMRHMKFEQDVKKALNWDRFYEGARPPTPESVGEKVKTAALAHHVPLQEKQLHVENVDGTIRVQAEYTERVNLPLYGAYNWTFKTHMVQEK